MKTFFAFALVILLAALTGCQTASADKAACNLSALTIKDIVLDGDEAGYVADAIGAQLYSRGAKSGKNGTSLTGKVKWEPAQSVLTVSIHGTLVPYASGQRIKPANLSEFPELVHYNQFVDKAAGKIAQDFCACAAAQQAKEVKQ